MNTQNQKDPILLFKTITLVAIMLICALFGSGLLFCMAYLGGMDLNQGMDVFEAVTEPAFRPFIKAGIGLNHLVMFALSAVIFAYWMRKKKWLSYFDFRSIDLDLLLKFVVLLFLTYPLIGLSSVVLERVDLPEWMKSLDEQSIESLMNMLKMDGVVDLIVNLVIIALIPAISEELLFRGIIQKELIKNMKSPQVAIFVASAIFSGFHLQVQGFLPKLIIGLVLGYAYYLTKSIWYPMVLHFVNNGLQVVMLFVAGDHLETAQKTEEKPEIVLLIMVVVFSCFLCHLLINHIIEIIDDKKGKYT
jgi:membrane protease YdiL (CAAX protease family)